MNKKLNKKQFQEINETLISLLNGLQNQIEEYEECYQNITQKNVNKTPKNIKEKETQID